MGISLVDFWVSVVLVVGGFCCMLEGFVCDLYANH